MCAAHYGPGIEIVPGYELIKLIGSGGFGDVWQAKGPGGVMVAIKVINKLDRKAGRREFQALKLMKDIRNPNLVSISGFWLKDQGGTLIDPEGISDEPSTSTIRPEELVIAMDLGDMTLFDYLEQCRKGLRPEEKGGVPLDELLDHMEAAARAIDYLNVTRKVQHRDIKPQNMLLVGGSVKICDYGLATALDSARSTKTGGAGSLAYMAPEIYTTKTPSSATDQYCLAISYVELRTGRLPLSDSENFSVLDEAKRKGNLDLTWLEEAERTIISKASSLNPEDRYPRCSDMVRALRRACETPNVPATAGEPTAVLGEYTLLRRMHQRMGEEVWEAMDSDKHRHQVVVRTPSESPGMADPRALILVRDASRRHENLDDLNEVVRLSDQNRPLPSRLFEGPHPPEFSKLLLVSRLPKRGDLSDHITTGGLTLAKLVGPMQQAAAALDFLNAQEHVWGSSRWRLIHANVRPANLHYDGETLRLTNFSAMQVSQSDEAPFAAGPEISEGPYKPPEFATGKITRWSDQYALAVTYLQLRTGKSLARLSNSSSSGLTGSRLSGASQLELTDLTEAEQAIVRRATSPTPSERYPSCGEFVAALDEIAKQSHPSGSTSSHSGSSPTIAAPPTQPSVPSGLGVTSDPTGVAVTAAQDQKIHPGFAGTLMVNNDTQLLGDTRKTPGDAPPAEVDQPAPGLTAGKHAKHQQTNKPHVPLARPEHSSATKKWIIGGVVAAGIVAAAVKFWPESNGGGSSGGDTNQSAAKQTTEEYYEDNIARLMKEQQFAEARSAVIAAPSEFDDSKTRWKTDIEQKWRDHVRQLVDGRHLDAALPALLRLLPAMQGSFQQEPEWMREVLTALNRRGEAELNAQGTDAAQKAQAAQVTFGRVIDAWAQLQQIPVGWWNSERLLLHEALVGRARARVRSGNAWVDVENDLKRLGEISHLKGALAAYAKTITVLARHGLGNSPPIDDVSKLLTEMTSQISTNSIEWKKLKDVHTELETVGDKVRLEQLRKLLTAASQHATVKDWAKVNASLDTIRQDEKLSAIARAAASGPSAMEYARLRLMSLAADGKSAITEVEDEFSRAEQLLRGAVAVDTRSVALAAAIKEVALQPGSVVGTLRHGKLVPRAAELLTSVSARATDAARKGELEKLLDPLNDEKARALLSNIRHLRDVANNDAGFRELQQACSDAAGKLTHPLLAACRVESAVILKQQTDIKPLLSALDRSKLTGDDALYAGHVWALAQFSAEPVEASKTLLSAWYGDGKPAPKLEPLWRLSPLRRERVVEKLLEVIDSKRGPKTPGDDLAGQRFTAESAQDVYPFAELAHRLSKSKPPELKADRALAMAALPKPPADTIKEVDTLIRSGEPASAQMQLLLASRQLHESAWKLDTQGDSADGHLQWVIVISGRLVKQSQENNIARGKVHEKVVAPTIGILEKMQSQRLASLPAKVREEAATLYLGHADSIRLDSDVQQKYASGGTEKEIYNACKAAGTLIPEDPKTLLQYATASFNLANITKQDSSEELRGIASNISKAAQQAPWPLVASAVQGMAAWNEAEEAFDFSVKLSKLAEAEKKLLPLYLQKDTFATEFRREDDYQELLFTLGAVYLKMANSHGDKAKAHSQLDEGCKIARHIVDEYTLRTKPYRVFLLWGNLLEDYDERAGKPGRYLEALEKFERGYTLAKNDFDQLGKAKAKMNQGRCKYKAALSEFKRTADKKQLVAQLTGAQSALTHLNDALTEGKGWAYYEAESHYWIGKIYQEESASNFTEADGNFARAVGFAAKESSNWPLLVTQRAENSLVFARREASKQRWDRQRVQTLVDQSQNYLAPLFTKPRDERIQLRHRLSAHAAIIGGHLLALDGVKAKKSLSDAEADVATESNPTAVTELYQKVAGAIIKLPGMKVAAKSPPKVAVKSPETTDDTRHRVPPEEENELALDVLTKWSNRLSKAEPEARYPAYIHLRFICVFWGGDNGAIKAAESAGNASEVLSGCKQFVPLAKLLLTYKDDADFLAYLRNKPDTTQYVDEFKVWEQRLQIFERELAARSAKTGGGNGH